MLTYIVRRLLLMCPTLLGITLLVFFSMALSPGGIGGPTLDKGGNEKSDVDAVRIRQYYEKRYGLDKPVLVQYARWINLVSPVGFKPNDDGTLGSFGVKWPSLGESLGRHRPVIELIEESLPLTLLLNVISIPIVYAFGVLSGITSAQRRGSTYDNFMSFSQLASWSIPTVWAGVMLIGFLANREYIHLFPTSGLHEAQSDIMPFLPHFTAAGWDRGWLLDTLWHLVLPVICLSYGGSAFLTKLTRGSILENLGSDYVRTARAKGLSENIVLYRHVFRNSVLALITVAASILPALLSGSVVVESIFSIPGMGKLAVEAVENRDRELVLAVTLIGGIIGLLSQLLRDVLYAIADPRVAYD
ncbi:MAG: ABC transporter permease [Tepidisphaeraceae bacterium]|jgi:ABC-type dipeptide/oligopeptide/nickel transport system permease component